MLLMTVQWRVQRLSNALSLLTLTCSCCCSDIAIGYLIYYGHVLLYLMGSEGREIYNTINFERSEEERKVEDVLKGLKDYCKPSKNKTVDDIAGFFTRVQGIDESID